MSNNGHKSLDAGASALLARCIAIFMLALFLPAAVVAAPLRYCVDGNGHRAIEFAHATASGHAAEMLLDDASLAAKLQEAHSVRSHCLDRLLLPLITKSKCCSVPGPRSDPVVATHLRYDLSAGAQRRAQLGSHLAISRLPQRDPHLVTLKTIVLLN